MKAWGDGGDWDATHRQQSCNGSGASRLTGRSATDCATQTSGWAAIWEATFSLPGAVGTSEALPRQSSAHPAIPEQSDGAWAAIFAQWSEGDSEAGIRDRHTAAWANPNWTATKATMTQTELNRRMT